MALEMGPAFCARWAALRSQRASRFYACGCFASRLADTYALCLGCLANRQQTGELVMIWRWLIPAMIGAACLVVSLASLLVRGFLGKATSRDIIPQRTREVQVHLARKEAVHMVATSDTRAMVHYQTEGKNKGQSAE